MEPLDIEPMNILLINAGSSSLKCSLFDSEKQFLIASGSADWAGNLTHYQYSVAGWPTRFEEVAWRGHGESVRRFLFDIEHASPQVLSNRSALIGVGHRIVHGGAFDRSVIISDEVRARIVALSELAPLHNPFSLEALAAAEAELPCVPHVAVFDTAFHATIPPEAYVYPVPRHWTVEWGIRRFGFHGLSHAYCARRAGEMLRRTGDDLRLVICHLGHGCSAAAVRGGRCIDTTMGFTPNDGLMMATRSGSLDPGILFHVQHRHGLSATEIETILNRQSGLLGVSSIAADMRQLLMHAKQENPQAQLALGIYTHRIRQAIGALAVTLGGVDAIVFTAGVGENASEIRESVCQGLDCLGLRLDPLANANCRPDADIATVTSPNRILVIATREDLTMLQEVAKLVTVC